jgi:imidazolonepropionase-like amidohydrolase
MNFRSSRPFARLIAGTHPARWAVLLLIHGTLARGAEHLVFNHATIHTVTGLTLTNASLEVREGKIAAMGTDLSAPGATRIDLKGAHLFPGLIAPVTMLGLIEIESVRATRDLNDVGDFTPDVYAWVAVHPDSDLIPVARANGITHAQAVPQGGVLSGHSAVIALSGWTIEDVAVRPAAALHLFWPSFELDLSPRQSGEGPGSTSMEEQVRRRDRRLHEIDEFFNQAEAYASLRNQGDPDLPVRLPGEPARRREPAGPAFNVVPAWEAMIPMLRGEIPLFVHANEVRQIRSAVEWVTRRKYRAVIAGGMDAGRVASLLASSGIPVAYEHTFTQPIRDTDPYDIHFAAPAAMARAGVKVAFAGGSGRDGGSGLRNLPYAAAQAVAFGMPEAEALRAITLYPAELLGLDSQLGSIEVGKDATFFIADGHILDIRTNVKRMWIRGREISLDSRHTRLYERYRNRPAATH